MKPLNHKVITRHKRGDIIQGIILGVCAIVAIALNIVKL